MRGILVMALLADVNPSYTFTTAGTYDVTLTVTDMGGLNDTSAGNNHNEGC